MCVNGVLVWTWVTDYSVCLCECVLCACLNSVRFAANDFCLHKTGFNTWVKKKASWKKAAAINLIQGPAEKKKNEWVTNQDILKKMIHCQIISKLALLTDNVFSNLLFENFPSFHLLKKEIYRSGCILLKPIAASFRWIPICSGASRYPPTPASCRKRRSSERWSTHRTTTQTSSPERSFSSSRRCRGRMLWTVCRCESRSAFPRHCRCTQTPTAGTGRLRWRRRTCCTSRKCYAKGPSQLVAQSVPGTSTN